MDHLTCVLDSMRPPAPARGPAHTSLCRWIVFVVDHWSGKETSHLNFLIILVHPFVHTQRNLLETQATVATRSRSCSFGRVFSCYRALFRYRLVQIERPKLCPREFLTPFFRVRPRNFAHIFWKAVSKTRRVFFFLIWGFAVEISGF